MAHIDVPRIRGKLAERGLNVSSASEQLGISRNTLAAYLKTPEKMPYRIVADLAKMLCGSESEAISIFFADDLRNT